MDHSQNEAIGIPQPAAKRAKRGKYVSKACFHCQRRKIRCDGKRICGPCVEKGRDCTRQSSSSSPRRSTMTPKAPAATISSKNSGNTREADTRTSNKSIPGDAILRRLAYLEEQLRSLQPVIDAPRTVLDSGTSASLRQANKEMDSSTQGSTEVPSSRPSQQTWLQPDTAPSTFEGESSIAHTLTELEDRLEHEGVTFKKVPTNLSSLPLTPAPSSPDDDHARGNALDHIRSILCSHGVTSNRSQWDGYLQTFLNEVHVLYPFLYPSTLHERYLGIWRYLDGRVIERTQDDHRAPAAQVLLCLALGRCETGSRSQTADVCHAAGWSLYSAASDLMGDPMSIFTRGWNTLLVLQNLVLMIAYLFRLDANDRASKLVALAVSQSHQLGLHRERVLSRMPPFEGEMFRRLWWCLYVLDRRVALETGSPYLVQDFNVDTRFPSELTNDRLSHPSRHLGLRNNNEVDGQAETFTGPDSLIPYLVGMIYYSRTVANVWEVLYKARGSDPQEGGWNPVPHDHLDFLISNAERQMPSALSGDLRVTTAVTDGRDWWKAKQKHLMRMRWSFLRLSIQRPLTARPTSAPFASETSTWENEYLCMRLVQSIFDQFRQLAEGPGHAGFQFPFLHYLARTAIISLGLIVKQPSFRQSYGVITLAVIRDLTVSCGKTWVSGKFMRAVNKLNEMAERVLGQRRLDSAPLPALVPAQSEIPEETTITHVAGQGQICTPLGDGGHAQPSRNDGFDSPVHRAAVDRPRAICSTRGGNVAIGEESNLITDAAGPASPGFSLSLLANPTYDIRGSPSPHSSLIAMIDLVTHDFDFEETIGNGDSASLPISLSGPPGASSMGPCEAKDGASGFWGNQQGSVNHDSDFDFTCPYSVTRQHPRDLQHNGLGNTSDWLQELLGNGMPMDVFMQW